MKKQSIAELDSCNASPEVPGSARVVVIGGGAVGVSVLYHLCQLGWTDVLLLEKNELTSGSTWHSAGNCPNFAASWTIMRLQSYSTNLYRKLSDLVDYPINYHVTGAVRLAHSRQRMEEFRHVQRMGSQMGVEFQEMSNDDMRDVYPFLETHELYGGQWDPYDGDIDPAQLTQALAKGARDKGAKIIRFCPVIDIQRKNREWVVVTPRGTIRAEYVVNAAGYRANEVGKFFGRNVPCIAIAHQYLVTESLPVLASRDAKLPLLRDPDSSYYLRQESDGLLLGPYEKHCRAHWIEANDSMPNDFSFQLYNDDLTRLEWYIEDACRRVPILGDAGIKRVVNGPIPYAPDGLPLIGQMPGVQNAYEACVFTFGIVQAGGAGKLLAEIIVEGEPETDSWAVDPRRFTDHVDCSYSLVKAIETYSHEYAMHFPQIQWPAGRKAKISPLYDKLQKKGAEFGSYGGWERADWFPDKGDKKGSANSFDRQHWFERVAAECLHVASHVGLIDLTGFSRFLVEGPGVEDWLANLVTGNLPKLGRMNLIYFASSGGKVLSEMTATRMADDKFLLISSSGAYWHDHDLLSFAIPSNNKIKIRDLTSETATLLVTGPKATSLLVDVVGMELIGVDFPWLTCRNIEICSAATQVIKVSYAGEAGWELHCPIDQVETIYETILAAGRRYKLQHFGMLALDSMRLEKGYRAWKHDLSSDYSMFESGLERWINLDKNDFVGKAALLDELKSGLKRRFVVMTLEDPEDDKPFGEAVYLSTVLVNNKPSGLVISGGYGHRVKKSIAMAVIEKRVISQYDLIQVDVLGRKRRAQLVPGNILYDPNNRRIKELC
ncbi:MAG: dimethylglycine dehydrogenase [Rhodospirillaceae bacterium]|nr:dimethylglycine dehydrogenase [Rhodospirillaceae bacterium]|tara:strand:- start:1658 stop:4156 length:2499 start_codon:yes stop_codon:yes gene_type:complete